MLSKEILDNNIICYQKSGLYHFTSDALILSRNIKVGYGEKIADFCSGSGIVALNTYALNTDKRIKEFALFELQQEMYNLSALSVKDNNLENIFSCYNIKIQEIPNKFNEYFSLILCNPPYFKKEDGNNSNDSIAICRNEIELNFDELAKAVSKALKFGGRFCFVHLSSRLAEIIYTLKNYNLEPKSIQFISGAKGIYLALIEAVKGGKTGIKIKDTIKN